MIPSNIVPSRISLLALLGVASAALAACDANPIGGGSGGGGGDDATSVSTNSAQGGNAAQGGRDAVGGNGASGGADAQHDSIALHGDQLPEVGSGGGTSTGVGGSGPGDDADRLYLFIADSPTSCSDPFAVDEACPVDTFRATIGLPTEYQQPGTYELADPAITASFGEWGSNEDGTCWGGGGSFFDGTIEIVSIDSERVRVILAGTSPALLDGQHTVMMCGGPEPIDGNVIGYYPSALPPPDGESSAVTTGGGEEEKFILVFADHGQSCADPFGNQPGPGEVHHDFVLRLPPSYLVPGTYDLADPAIETDKFEYEQNSAATGADGTNVGTLTIHEVGVDFIDLELTGTQFDFANVATVVPRCGG